MRTFIASLALLLARAVGLTAAKEPFLEQIGARTWVIGNDVWNMTQGRTYGVKLWYKGRDCVGDAVGHYVSYSKLPPLSPAPSPPLRDVGKDIVNYLTHPRRCRRQP